MSDTYVTMAPATRNRLLLLGSLWGLVLAVPAALLMADGLSGLLVVAVGCALLCGALGTLLAGRRVVGALSAGRKRRTGVFGGMGTGVMQGLFAGVIAAFLVWVLMSATITGLAPGHLVSPSAFTEPRVLLGSFFVALSAFVYALVGGLLLGPLFGRLIERTTAKEGGGVR